MDVPGHIDQARVDEKAGGSKDGWDQPVICCFLNLSPECAGHPYLGCRKQNKCGIMLKTDLHMGQCKADNDIVDRNGQQIDPAGYFLFYKRIPPYTASRRIEKDLQRLSNPQITPWEQRRSLPFPQRQPRWGRTGGRSGQ